VFEEEKHSIKSFFRENKAGIYATVSIHLLVLIILLIFQIHNIREIEMPFVIDFTKQEEAEKLTEKQARREKFEKELDAMLVPARHVNVRNAAVDETEQTLRDDRHSNPSAVYDEAARVQARLDASRAAMQQQQGGDDMVQAGTNTGGNQADVYKGPSVLSYNLGGRKAMSLPVPVYKCRAGGDVTVQIEVNRKGYVTDAVVNTSKSTGNTCLHEAARRAASASRFAVDGKAPEPQRGYIAYRFIAQ
jgi:TonB family protein